MAKVLAKVPAQKQHPLALELRSILDNPNASLGQLASVVQRINAELKLFEAASKRQLKEASTGKGNAAASKAEIEALRVLIAGIEGKTRSVKSR